MHAAQAGLLELCGDPLFVRPELRRVNLGAREWEMGPRRGPGRI